MIINLETPADVKIGDFLLNALTTGLLFAPESRVVGVRKGRCEGANVVWITTADGVEEPFWIGPLEVFRPTIPVNWGVILVDGSEAILEAIGFTNKGHMVAEILNSEVEFVCIPETGWMDVFDVATQIKIREFVSAATEPPREIRITAISAPLGKKTKFLGPNNMGGMRRNWDSVTTPGELGVDASVLAAMSGANFVPDVLAGLIREASPARPTRQEPRKVKTVVTTPVVEVETEDTGKVSDVSEAGILVEVGGCAEIKGDIAEVTAVVETDDGRVWARIVLSGGFVCDVEADLWEREFGRAAELEIISAWDKSFIRSLLSV